MPTIISLIEALLRNQNLLHEDKIRLRFLLNLVHKIEQNPILIRQDKFNLTAIPLTQNGYDDLFIASDCETDNPQFWQKVMQNGKVIEVNSGDILIQFKP